MQDNNSILIPRNVLNDHDKFPVDFFIKFNISTRQIPYILVGGAIATSVAMFAPLALMPKVAISMFSMGMNVAMSDIKIEGEYFEDLLFKSIKYKVVKKRFDKKVKK